VQSVEISVPALYGVSNSIQIRGMYIILFLKVLKTKDYVHNVRKWPNLCSIGLGMFRKLIVQFKLVEKFGPIDQFFFKHSQVKRYPNI
jgi:hypothetical protein